jgi:hypothetical protein
VDDHGSDFEWPGMSPSSLGGGMGLARIFSLAGAIEK